MKILLFTIVFCFFPFQGFAQWVHVLNNEADCLLVRDSIVHADAGLVSSDSGATWIGVPGDTTLLIVGTLRAVKTNSDGSMIFIATDSGIYRFTYADNKWTNVLRYNYEFSVGFFAGYLFASDSGAIIRSSDFGDHWQRFKPIIPLNFGMQSFFSYNSDIFIGTEYNGMYRSSDTGKSWVKVDTKSYGNQFISFDTIGRDIYSLSYNWGVIVSHDSGKNWIVTDTSGLSRDFSSFITRGSYFFGGITGTFGGVFLSPDSGKTWNQIGYMERVLCLATIGDYIIAGTRFGIYRAALSDLGIDAVISAPRNISKLSLLSNPITTSADFQFDALKEASVFEVFDLLGRSLLRQEVSAGQESLHLDMQQYPPGIYFARLGTETLRFIKE
jgi:hypothetical protein